MDFNNLSSQDWQRFCYFALILVALTVSVVSRQELKITKILKYLGIWSGIGIVLIALYSYRYEFSDFKNRILGEIAPSSAQTNKSGQIVISSSQDGHFYINAKVNKVDVRFMVDTGASDITLNLNDAQRIGIKSEDLIYIKQYQTANGRSLGASIKLDELEMGDVKFENLSASVTNGNLGISLLGMSFLKQLKKYEFYQDKLILTI